MMRWVAWGIACAAFLTFAALTYYVTVEETKQPRFYDVELRPGLVCLWDRVQNEPVDGTCREVRR